MGDKSPTQPREKDVKVCDSLEMSMSLNDRVSTVSDSDELAVMHVATSRPALVGVSTKIERKTLSTERHDLPDLTSLLDRISHSRVKSSSSLVLSVDNDEGVGVLSITSA